MDVCINSRVYQAAGGDDGDNLLTSLISWWELEEASGDRIDAVGASGNDLTDNATVTRNTGVVGFAAEFVRVNSEYLSRPNNVSLQAGDVDHAYCGWFTFPSTTGLPYVPAAKSDSTTGAGFTITINTSSELTFVLWQVGGAAAAAATPIAVSDGPWHFFVAWFDAAEGKIYLSVNNSAPAGVAKTGTPGSDTLAFTIGARADATGFYNGRIDQFGYWKGRFPTAAERTWLYNSGNGRAFSELGP